MQVITKPRPHRLPLLLRQPPPRPISRSKPLPPPHIVYLKGAPHSRALIRKAISTSLSYQVNPGYQIRASEQIIRGLRESVRALSYTSAGYAVVRECLRQIFGGDIEVRDKDVIGARGQITMNYYVFFTAGGYKPYSLCCKVEVYLRIEKNKIKSANRYSLHLDEGDESDMNNCKTVTHFICKKCEQKVLTIETLTANYVQEEKKLGKETLNLELQRQKISMSIMIASGKFKKYRIDEGSHFRDRTLPLVKSKLSQIVIDRKKSHTTIDKNTPAFPRQT